MALIRIISTVRIVFFLCVMSIAGAGIANAQDSASHWKYNVGVYLWVADVEGTTADGTNIDVSFSDLADDLDLGFMGAFWAYKGKWMIGADLIYLDVTAKDTVDTSVPVGPINIDVRAKAKLNLKTTKTQIVGGYNLLDDTANSLYVLGGVRYLDLETDLRLNVEALGAGGSIKQSENGYVWDGIVGIKGRFALAENWSLPYYLDVGTGDSDITYQASTGASYRAGDSFNVLLLYRYLHWEFDSGPAIQDLTFKGPMLGGIYRF